MQKKNSCIFFVVRTNEGGRGRGGLGSCDNLRHREGEGELGKKCPNSLDVIFERSLESRIL